MGDSITEGSIANVLKQASDSVDEDEPILQIETDKVTLDVRAPMQGTLRAIMVKEEDTVTVGQVVAVLDEAETTRRGASAAPEASSSASAPQESGYAAGASTKPPAARQQSLEELTDAASEVSDSAMRGHKARIRFPPRRTEAGATISAMPAVDQKTYTAREQSSREQQASRPPPHTGQPHTSTTPAEAFSKVPVQRSKMLEMEMEAIMLGGAPP